MKRLLMPLLAVAVVAFAGLGINQVTTTEEKLQLREVQLESTTNEAKQLKLDLKVNNQKLDEALHKSTVDQAEVDKLRQENEQLRQRAEDAEKQAAIRKENARIAAEKANEASRVALNRATGTATASAAGRFTGGGNKEAWLAASGIPRSEWWAVDSIVSRESGWNPCAYNPGRSDCNANPTSACGLAQSLPCGKQAKYGHWTDPVANLKWQYDYVRERYGGYPQAVAFWNANHWY